MGDMTVNMNRQQTGFTLTELLITLAIAALLMTMAVPNFRDFIMNNRLTTQANEFIGALNLARSEAVKRGESITVCSSDDQASCTGTAWNAGWIVMVTGDSSVLRVYDALPGATTLTNASSNFSVQYDSNGFLNSGATNTFNLCDDRTGETGRQIVVTGTGRPDNTTPYPTCS